MKFFRYEDATATFDKPNRASTGFQERMKLFLESDGSMFSTEWVQLSGRLYFDLEYLATGILPGIQVQIFLDYSSDNFRLITSETEATYPKINDVVLEIGYVRKYLTSKI